MKQLITSSKNILVNAFLFLALPLFAQKSDRPLPSTGDNQKLNVESINASRQVVSPALHVLDSIEIGNSIWIGGARTGEDNRIYTDDEDLYIQSEDYPYNTLFGIGNLSNVGIGIRHPDARLHISDGRLNERSENECEPLFKASFDNQIRDCDHNPTVFLVEEMREEVSIPVFNINSRRQVGIGRLPNADDPQFTISGAVRMDQLGGANSGLVITDNSGKLSRMSMGLSSQVLSGNGWINSSNMSQWVDFGTGIYYQVGNVGIGNMTAAEKLDVGGNMQLNGYSLYLKTGSHDNGLAYNPFTNLPFVNGPVLFGQGGGALGSRQNVTENIALRWTNTGSVSINSLNNGNGIVMADNTGTLSKMSMGGSNQVLTGSGWSTIALNQWQTASNGHDIYFNQGNVGIGNSSPTEALQIGDYWTFHNGGSKVIGFNFHYVGPNAVRLVDGYSADIGYDVGGNLHFEVADYGATGSNISYRKGILINNQGYVGVGTNNPIGSFQVNDGANKLSIGGAYGATLNYGTSYVGFNLTNTPSGWFSSLDGAGCCHNGGAMIYGDINGNLRFVTVENNSPSPTTDQLHSDAEIAARTKMIIYDNGKIDLFKSDNGEAFSIINKNYNNTNSSKEVVKMWADGRVSLGGDPNAGDPAYVPPGYQLAIHGKAIAQEIVVQVQPWPDYVFGDNYELKSLNELKDFINKNGRLPGIQSSAEVETSGLSVGQVMSKQMEKIEELTLYVLQLNEKIEDLKKENSEMLSKLTNK